MRELTQRIITLLMHHGVIESTYELSTLAREDLDKLVSSFKARDFMLFITPDSDEHRALVIKLARARSGEVVPLGPNEMLLLEDIRIWPPRTV